MKRGREKLIILACFLSLIILASFVSVVSASCPSGMVGYWKFDSSSQLGKDYTGINNGTASGDAVYTSSGKLNGALNLDGNGDYINIPDSNSLDLTSFTTEAWFKVDSLPTGYKTIVMKGEDSSTDGWNYGMYLGTSYGGGCTYGQNLIVCTVESATSSSDTTHKYLFYPMTSSEHVGKWVHAACTLDGTDWRIYVNGVDKTSDSQTKLRDYYCEDSSLTSVPTTGNSPLHIGAVNLVASGSGEESGVLRFFDGEIDEVAVYNAALTSDEINSHYNDPRDYCASDVQSTCPENQTIMKLFSSTNAHGALWNYEEGCSGSSSVSCGDYNSNENSCINSGCVWNPGTSGTAGSCSGNTWCYYFTTQNPSFCNAINGCSWDYGEGASGCSGYISCVGLTQEYCQMSNECTWTPGTLGTNPTCTGTPKTCENYFLEESCEGAGCNWNPGYNYNVCYSNIFGTEYAVSAGENPHDCSGNRVLSLYDTFNAHASVSPSPDYDVPVCYGNLVCRSTTGNCNADEKIVVRLKQDANSHISNASDTDYPIKICCKPGITSTVTGTYWANMNGVAINTANLNDKVKLIVEGSELAGDINYTISQCETVCSLTNGGITWWDTKVAIVSSELGVVKWRAGKKSDGTLSEGNYYFKVKVGGVEYSTLDNPNINYRELAVSSPQSNSKPIVNITSPKDRQMYFLLENLNFTASITDEDDDFDYTWDLGNGVKKSGNSITWNDYRFFYAYNTENQKDIVLTATDERGASSRAQVSILIINESSYALAYIDEPRFGEAYGRIVDFNASGSYVVNSTHNTDGTRKITCLAGNCPSQTEGCPPPGAGCHIPVEETPKSLDAVNFYWIFDNGVKTKNKTGLEHGNQFTEMFASTGEHTAELTINFNPFSTTRTKFGVYFDDPTCVIDNGESYWYEGTSITESSDNCYRADGIGINGNPGTDCCIPGEHCNNDGNCVPGGIGCEQFTDDLSCEQDGGINADSILESIVNCNVPDNFGTSGTCWNMTRCQCEWDEDTCRAVAENVIWHQTQEGGEDSYEEWTYDDVPSNIGVICEGGDAGSLGDCKFNFLTTDNCENTGFIERSWTVGWTPIITPSTQPSWCSNGNDEIPCIGVAKLAFFTITGLIVAIVLIVIIYIIIVSKKKKYSKERTGKEKTIKRKKRI